MTVLFLIAIAYPLGNIIRNTEARFSPLLLTCIFPDRTDRIIAAVFICVFILLPMLVLITANINIIWIVVKSADNTGRRTISRAAVTILYICLAFVVSYIPAFINVLLTSTLKVDVPTWFIMFAIYTKSINSLANPPIYCITNKRFRRFLKSICKPNSDPLRRSVVISNSIATDEFELEGTEMNELNKAHNAPDVIQASIS